jgi:hypothetical protein
MNDIKEERVREERVRLEELKDDTQAKISELLEKKKEIDAQLRKLRDVDIRSGCVKLRVIKPSKRELRRREDYTLYSLSLVRETCTGENRWFPVSRDCNTKQDILDVISEVVSDLQELYKKIEESLQMP